MNIATVTGGSTFTIFGRVSMQQRRGVGHATFQNLLIYFPLCCTYFLFFGCKCRYNPNSAIFFLNFLIFDSSVPIYIYCRD